MRQTTQPRLVEQHKYSEAFILFFSLMKRTKNQGLQKKKLKIVRRV